MPEPRLIADCDTSLRLLPHTAGAICSLQRRGRSRSNLHLPHYTHRVRDPSSNAIVTSTCARFAAASLDVPSLVSPNKGTVSQVAHRSTDNLVVWGKRQCFSQTNRVRQCTVAFENVLCFLISPVQPNHSRRTLRTANHPIEKDV